MDRHKVYAVGKDKCWLTAVSSLDDQLFLVKEILCSVSDPDCLATLPEPDPEALLIVDADDHPSPAEVVRALGVLGWNRIIVVAADSSWKRARDVLKTACAIDYWQKSYDSCVLRRKIRAAVSDADRRSMSIAPPRKDIE